MKVSVITEPTAIPYADVEYDRAFVMAEDYDNGAEPDVCWRNPADDNLYYRLVLGRLETYEIEEPEDELVYLVDIKEVILVLK